ncbi:MAG: sugar kinase [Microbacterium sp. 71-36]|uniref:ROK family protein n=1 Tax=unclassified Microbacterium TaxID=2609290 RepID=UPI0008697C5B|nr:MULTISPECIES: ROK family protein [unclassified Microbacterium]MBN9211156.1 ROK family protein [Microbacterium sp.]ODT37366.1 MAG: sugar kinase [Microbacterium sp. SCN 71-17]OJV77741.1 MAG: sugar kinase [Microbacterium sp. 71-36]
MSPAAPVLAVDIGGTKVDAAVVTAAGEVVRASVARRPTGRDTSREGIAANIRAAAEEALAAVPELRVGAIGVGSAGPVDLPARSVSPLNLPQAAGLPIDEVLAGLVDGPISLALDGTCIALAEHWRGALVGTQNAMAIVVSTGVGGGLILGGRPISGASGNAGHLGQTFVRTLETDAAAATLEAVAAGPGSVAWARTQGWVGETGLDLAAAYREGDAVAVAAVRRSASAVGQAIAAAATLCDLEAVAIAGGFSHVADDYVDLVAAAAVAASVHAYARRCRVVPSGLDGDGPLLGAAALALGA